MHTSFSPFKQVVRKFKPSQSWEAFLGHFYPGHCLGTTPHSNWHIS